MRCPNCNHFYLFDNKYICPKCGEILDYQFKKDVEYFANKYGEVSYQFFDYANAEVLANWFNQNGNKINILKFDIGKSRKTDDFDKHPFSFYNIIIIYIDRPGPYYYRATTFLGKTFHSYENAINDIDYSIQNYLRNNVWNNVFSRVYYKYVPLGLNVRFYYEQHCYNAFGFVIAAFRR